ncbi:MAG: S-methyl-5'-thioadenosine phosphorylase [Myxococcota bacterium]
MTPPDVEAPSDDEARLDVTPPSDDGNAEILAVIGGSGCYRLPELADVERVSVATPYGPPSDAIVRGRLGPHTLLFLPRHGAGHRLAPHTIPYRANVAALKQLGATQVLSLSAVGSLQDDIAPGDFVVVDQFIDFTKRRAATFFDAGAVAHVALADPVCPTLAARVAATMVDVLAEAATAPADPIVRPPRVHPRGTYLCIEGPQFSTRAESRLYRRWGVDVLGMTNLPEAKLAREAELPYATLGMVTDYDCWHHDRADVDVTAMIALLDAMVTRARAMVARVSRRLPDHRDSPAATALDGCVMTPWSSLTPERQKTLSWLLGPDGPRRRGRRQPRG